MLKVLMTILVSCFSGVANADIFKFDSLKNYEKCLKTDHMVETQKSGSKDQSRFLGAVDIQLRCVESAEELLKDDKNKVNLLQFVKTTKQNTAHENSLGIIRILANAHIIACNEIEVYEVLTKALSGPKNEAVDSYYSTAKQVVKICLKDAEFRKDFEDEIGNTNPYLGPNVCEILKEEKIVKSCQKK